MEINTTLLREKFIIRDNQHLEQEPIVALSNRISLNLQTPNGNLTDTIVVRTQSMHSCIRMAALLLQSFIESGPLFARVPAYDFDSTWNEAISDQDRLLATPPWCAVYHHGKEIFSAGATPIFLAIVERCDSKNPESYDKSIKIAEETFKKMERNVSIAYETNIGMVLHIKKDLARCGLIHRSAFRNSTFNLTLEPAEDGWVSPVDCMNLCADFLEGLQLAFAVGMKKSKLKSANTNKLHQGAQELELTTEYIKSLDYRIDSFIPLYKMRYRPERPDFLSSIDQTENFFNNQ